MVKRVGPVVLMRCRGPAIGLAVAILSWTATSAFATPDWIWMDAATGRKVYSDMPPPGSVPDKDIIRRPGPMPAYLPPASSTPDTAAPAPAKAAGASTDAADPAQARKKREADAAEAARRKADEEQRAALKADNCARARSGLSTLTSGSRVTITNAQGERAYMDDTARAAEVQRLQQVAQDNCQ